MAHLCPKRGREKGVWVELTFCRSLRSWLEVPETSRLTDLHKSIYFPFCNLGFFKDRKM